MAEIEGPGYPGTWPQFLAWFPDEAACAAYLERLRWPAGIACSGCGERRGWRTGEGRWWMCAGCARKTSVTAGTIFDKTRTPLQTWFAAAWWMTSQKHGLSALGLQRALGLGSYQTAWMMLHRFRVAMVRPDRDRLAGNVEVDESYVGGNEEGARGRQTETKSRVAIAVEVHEPKGFGRIRLARIPDVSKASLIPFVKAAVEPGSTVRTDGWQAYWTVPDHGYTHDRILISHGDDPAHVAMPAAHRVASLLKRWLLGTHQGSVSPQHLDAYLNEFAFRFNRPTSRRRGLLFYRLLQQALLTPPTTYKQTISAQQPNSS
ncbi:MAG: IS1595 family transposase [Actinobacteria bacterium]|nr:IS1595 family transposase [Actinomycetota bacterium]